jgi:hypothetical protein
MSYPINYPTPQGANVQIFQAPTRLLTTSFSAEWVKPQGASFVWFTLIGAGGATDGSASNLLGGGSGAVTNCMVPAFLIPDVLQVRVGKGGYNTSPTGIAGGATQIAYQQKAGTAYVLLNANGGEPGNTAGAPGGTADVSNYFSAMGFFQSIAGQAGVNGTQSPSATTFLSGGSYVGPVTSNYGYSAGGNGFFQMQPIIVGVGSSGWVGVGGGGSGTISSTTRGVGGDGLAVIVTW